MAVNAVPPLREKDGDAKLVLAVRTVNAPVFGVVKPMALGTPHVKPCRKLALRLATSVVESMVKGAVPVVTSEVQGTRKVIPPPITNTPLKLGEPLKVPAREPPAVRFDGPFEVKPTFIVTAPLNIVGPLKVLVPVQVLLLARMVPDEELIPSSNRICTPVTQLTPPCDTSFIR